MSRRNQLVISAPLPSRQRPWWSFGRPLWQADSNGMAAPKPGCYDSLGRYTLPVLELSPVILLVGTALGFLSGLGIGGGSLLILWLTLVMQADTPTARQINLLFFLPSALIAAFFRWKQGSVPLKKIWPAILAGCAGALIVSLLTQKLNVSLLKKLFGMLLIITGLTEIFRKQKTTGEGR